MKSFEEISKKIIRLIQHCLIITIPDEKIPIDYLTRKYFQSIFIEKQQQQRNRSAISSYNNHDGNDSDNNQNKTIKWLTINDKRVIFALIFLLVFIVRSFFLAIFIDKNDKQNLYLTLFGSGFRLINGDTFCLEMTTCLLSFVALIQWIVIFKSNETNMFFKLNMINVKQIYILIYNQLKLIENHNKLTLIKQNNDYQPDITIWLLINFFAMIRIGCTFGIPFVIYITSMAIFFIGDPKMNNFHLFFNSYIVYYGYSSFISLIWSLWAFIMIDLASSTIILFPIILSILRYKTARLIEYIDYQLERINMINYNSKLKRQNAQQINICIQKYIRSINLLIDEILFQIKNWSLHLTTLYHSSIIIIGFFFYIITSIEMEWLFYLTFIILIILSMTMLFAYTKSAAKFNLQSYRISIHDLQTILPKYRITFRNHIKIINHITLIDTNSLIFHQSDGIKLGPITQVTVSYFSPDYLN